MENKEDKRKTIGQPVCYFPIQRFAARELKTQIHPAASSHLHLSALYPFHLLPTTLPLLFTFHFISCSSHRLCRMKLVTHLPF